MAFVEVHTGIISSPKLAPLSDGALRLWLHALCWSKEHLTDGFIPLDMLPTLHKRASRFVGELLRSSVPGKQPLWHRDDRGYHIHDYVDWQKTAATVQKRRRGWRKQKGYSAADSTAESAPESVAESAPESMPESHSDSGADSATRLIQIGRSRSERDTQSGDHFGTGIPARTVGFAPPGTQKETHKERLQRAEGDRALRLLEAAAIRELAKAPR